MLNSFIPWKKDKRNESGLESNDIQYHKDYKSLVQQLEQKREEIKHLKFQVLKTNKALEDHKEVLLSIKQILLKDQEETFSKQLSSRILRLVNNLDNAEHADVNIQLENIYQDFILKLKKAHPSLTLYDLKLSMYIKMGLSSKEIASILNILPSSINVSRSRLRKKLQLKSQEDLFLILNKV